jgi:hypothetical protein
MALLLPIVVENLEDYDRLAQAIKRPHYHFWMICYHPVDTAPFHSLHIPLFIDCVYKQRNVMGVEVREESAP